MASKFAILGGAALALLMVLSFPFAADARHGGGGFGGGHMGGMHMGGGHMGGMHMGGMHMGGPAMGRVHMGGNPHFFRSPAPFAHRAVFHDGRFHRNAFFHDRRFHHRRFHRNAFFVAPVVYPYYSSYYYNDGCYWLRRNALYSGSPYWWNRYHACVYGYGY